jgi:hypothetical protein
MTIKLIDLVQNNAKAYFLFYRSGNLWYRIDNNEIHFEFPIPISECGDAVFPYEEKALLLMRYIRNQLNLIESAKQEITEK